LTGNFDILYTSSMVFVPSTSHSSHLLPDKSRSGNALPLGMAVSRSHPNVYSLSGQNLITKDNKTQHFQKSFQDRGLVRYQRENAFPRICFPRMLTRPTKIHTRSRHLSAHKSLLPHHLRGAAATLDIRFETPFRTKTHLRSNDSITYTSIFLVFVSKCRKSSHRPSLREPNFARFAGATSALRFETTCLIPRTATGPPRELQMLAESIGWRERQEPDRGFRPRRFSDV
jgi:hypothetical protein